jgi:LysM repeat protein
MEMSTSTSARKNGRDKLMSISNTIESYRKRRKRPAPIYIIGIIAILLVIIGIIVLVNSLQGGVLARAFATKTLTPTITQTASNTPLPTETPTITPTETITETPTKSQHYSYVVQEGDTLTSIIKDQNLGDNALILIYILNGTNIDPLTGFINVGQTITLPYPGEPLPTPTPVPTGLTNGTKITYRVMPGDSLGYIAIQFNTTAAAIVAANKNVLTDGENSMIYPGQLLLVPINLVTAVPSKTPTLTLTPLSP